MSQGIFKGFLRSDYRGTGCHGCHMSPPLYALESGLLKFLWRAGIANRLDAANLDDWACAAGAGRSPDRHLVTHVFGKAFGWKAVRFQIGDRLKRAVVNQNVAAGIVSPATG